MKHITSLILLSLAQLGHAQLLVDLGVTGANLQSGYQAYAAANVVPNPAPVAYTAASTGFASPVTVDVDALLNSVVVTTNTPANLFRVINRTPAAGNTNLPTTLPDVMRDWIGVTQLAGQAETVLRITVTGLPDGDYNWTSYHHDINDQTGLTDVSVAANGGSPVTSVVDQSNGITQVANGNNNAFLGSVTGTNTPTTFVTPFSIIGGGSFVFTISPQVAPNTAALVPSQFAQTAFAVINAFEISAVPEPSTAMLGLLGLLGLSRRRRA